jgi:probable F420-dependent oxidoreductase
MKFLYLFPGRTVPPNLSLLDAAAMSELAETAERAGFAGVGLDEHPAPPHRLRRDAAGHDSMDPVVSLAAVAAATTKIRLFTHLVVVPYRNPFLLAKAVATLDVLSKGRVELGVGTGYLEGEFEALGVNFAHRNERFDESIEVMRLAWTGDPVTYRGADFNAVAVSAHPRPTQRPHPPLWIGGNSRRTLRRVVAIGRGWMSLANPRTHTISRHSAPLESLDDLRALLEILREYATEAGRTEPIDVLYTMRRSGSASYQIASLQALASIGVTWVAHMGKGSTVAEAVEDVNRYGEEIIRHC